MGRGTALHSIKALSRLMAGQSAIGRRDAGYWQRCAGSPYIHEKSFDNRSMIKKRDGRAAFPVETRILFLFLHLCCPAYHRNRFLRMFPPALLHFPICLKVTPSYAAVCRREDASGSFWAFTPGGDLLDADSMGLARLDRFTASGFSGPACTPALRRTRCA